MYAKCGSLKQARYVFYSTQNPDIVSWSSLIVSYAQFGLGHEALNLFIMIRNLDVQPNEVTYLRFSVHAVTLDLWRKRAAENILKLDPCNSAALILLSNIHAYVGNQKEVAILRNLMKEMGVQKIPGQSWIEVKDQIHVFFLEDSSHSQRGKIYMMLEDVWLHMLDHGYDPCQRKKIENVKILSVAEDESVKTREVVEEKTASTKKRKRKGTSSETVAGFNVFRSSTSVAQSSGETQVDEESIELNKKKKKKEQNRQLERDAIFRKQHNIHVSGYNVPSPLQSFDELKSRYNCPSYLLRNLKELGFREPTPIQRQAIPVLLDGRECFACAPTGSGKTLAFVCPMLMKLKDPEKELSIWSWMNRIKLFKQIDSVLKACSNPSIIRSLFSATLPDFVEDRARELMHDAVRVIVGRKNMASETIKQKLVFTGSEDGKLLAIRQSFAESLNPPVLVFLQSKERAKELYGELAFDNVRIDVIHSDLSQQEVVLYPFEHHKIFIAGKTWVLIATDVVARGMDFKGVNCVINYDFPDCASAYVHRIGQGGLEKRLLFTEEDIPFLRNVANLMAASGCEVPSCLMELQKKEVEEAPAQKRFNLNKTRPITA
ncbi:unnamed protein product [Sphenostylis stenocarpa]|uniref:RNA helicase n=1 Tax=Sphenostylis stenocarpa TaxID=92480 RepID=A0AA86VLS8_9FABA|nr:unnamed protein product [Sphenostylis stenocarpa]